MFYLHGLVPPQGETWWLNAIQYGAPLALAGAVATARSGGRERSRAEVAIISAKERPPGEALHECWNREPALSRLTRRLSNARERAGRRAESAERC
ncbi:MAG: hypothetical protein JSV79_11745 [Armatimonadota bacterium]|nr:MAG: hypothetical protein JSV79_11745 [Armatimonadota bacterium]